MPITTADLWSVETVKSLVVEPVFATSVVLSSGLTRIATTESKINIPNVSGGTAAWHSDLDELTDAAVAADEIEVTPKKVGCIQLVSNESANDAAAAEIIGQALTGALADKVDHAFFVGDAPKGPAGLPGAGAAVVPVDASPTSGLDPYTDAIAAVENNGGTATIAFINPLDWAALSKVKETTTSAQPVLNAQPTQAGQRSILGLTVRTSKHVPTGTAYVLDASRVVVVERQPASVEVDTSSAFTRDGRNVRAIMRVEFAFPQAGMVAKINDVA